MPPTHSYAHWTVPPASGEAADVITGTGTTVESWSWIRAEAIGLAFDLRLLLQ